MQQTGYISQSKLIQDYISSITKFLKMSQLTGHPRIFILNLHNTKFSYLCYLFIYLLCYFVLFKSVYREKTFKKWRISRIQPFKSSWKYYFYRRPIEDVSETDIPDRRSIGDLSETNMPNRKPIGNLNMLHRRPIWNRHASIYYSNIHIYK